MNPRNSEKRSHLTSSFCFHASASASAPVFLVAFNNAEQPNHSQVILKKAIIIIIIMKCCNKDECLS